MVIDLQEYSKKKRIRENRKVHSKFQIIDDPELEFELIFKPEDGSNGSKTKEPKNKEGVVPTLKEAKTKYIRPTLKNGELVEIPITNFILKPKSLKIFADSDEEIALECILISKDGINTEVSLSPRSFDSRREFLNAINSFGAIFTGNQTDLQLMKLLVYKGAKKLDKGIVFRTGGMHYLDGGWIFVSPEGSLDEVGDINKEIRQINPNARDSDLLLQVEKLTPEELSIIGENLFKFNSRTISFILVSYVAAVFLKQRLQTSFGLRFPHLMITGQSGSGKSTTLEHIIKKMLGIVGGTLNATGISRFAANTISAVNNTKPLIIDEYKPKYMDSYQKDMLSNIARSLYDEHSNVRGGLDSKIQQTSLTSPLILLGESSMQEETAVVERSVFLRFSRGESANSRNEFQTLKNTGLLGGLGRSLLETALGMNEEQLQNLHDLCKLEVSKMDLSADRLSDQALMLFMGYKLLEMVYTQAGLEFSEFNESDDNKVLTLIKDNITKENSHCGDMAKSDLAITLEEVDRILPEINPNEIDKYLQIPSPNKSSIGINLNNMFSMLNDKGNLNGTLAKKDFKRQLKKSTYFEYQDGSESRKFDIYRDGKIITSLAYHFINIRSATNQGIYLPNMSLYLEQRRNLK